MILNVAINGFGRIGRNIFRALYEGEWSDTFRLVAINDLGAPELNAHLAQFDSIHGRLNRKINVVDGDFILDDVKIPVFQERDVSKLPWADLAVDVVFECTGLKTDRQAASEHLSSGAKRVLISAPSADADRTIVYGVNEHELTTADHIVSCASCTTNCLAPLAKILNEKVGIEQGMMTTIHAYTNDQNVQDSYHSDPYRARAAGLSMIPTKTGAAKAVAAVLPELAGKLDGMAVRVPIANVSLVDFNFTASRTTTVDEINAMFLDASNKLPNILHYNALPLVSSDFNHYSASSCFDAGQTKVNGKMVKLMAWYDNEWGFSNRMLDVAALMS